MGVVDLDKRVFLEFLDDAGNVVVRQASRTSQRSRAGAALLCGHLLTPHDVLLTGDTIELSLAAGPSRLFARAQVVGDAVPCRTGVTATVDILGTSIIASHGSTPPSRIPDGSPEAPLPLQVRKGSQSGPSRLSPPPVVSPSPLWDPAGPFGPQALAAPAPVMDLPLSAIVPLSLPQPAAPVVFGGHVAVPLDVPLESEDDSTFPSPLVAHAPRSAPPPELYGEAKRDDSDEDDDDDDITGVLGSLKEMPLSEIVQSLLHNRKDAYVEIKPKRHPAGELGFEKGRLVFARTSAFESMSPLDGEQAFFALAAATRGAFRIRYGRVAPIQNIARDTEFLLFEAMRLIDEAAVKQAPKEPSPLSTTGSGRFSQFFSEAGVHVSSSERDDVDLLVKPQLTLAAPEDRMAQAATFFEFDNLLDSEEETRLDPQQHAPDSLTEPTL